MISATNRVGEPAQDASWASANRRRTGVAHASSSPWPCRRSPPALTRFFVRTLYRPLSHRRPLARSVVSRLRRTLNMDVAGGAIIADSNPPIASFRQLAGRVAARGAACSCLALRVATAARALEDVVNLNQPGVAARTCHPGSRARPVVVGPASVAAVGVVRRAALAQSTSRKLPSQRYRVAVRSRNGADGRAVTLQPAGDDARDDAPRRRTCANPHSDAERSGAPATPEMALAAVGCRRAVRR